MSRATKYFSIIHMLAAYREPLFLIAFIASLEFVIGPHLNSPEQAIDAMHKVYNSSPHYEWRLVEPHRPTK
jgi:hypothetical protein